MKRIFVIVCILFASCHKPIDLALPVHEPKLVLHGYVAVDELFEVAIGKSIRGSEEMNGSTSFVDNAWVVVYENGLALDSLRYEAQKKRYSSQSVVAVAGKTYTIKAGADGFPTVEAMATASLPVNTISVTHDKQVRTTYYGEFMDDIKFSFQDVASEKNFYLTALFPSEYGRVGLLCVYSSDPAIERTQGNTLPLDESGCIDNDEILFSDKSFNGAIKEFTLSVDSKSMETATDPQGNLHRPYLKRYSISEQHYTYFKQSLSAFDNGDFPAIHEPVMVKGNVKNGYGLFVIFSVSTDTLR
jgi:hypothetical protein